ncbi:glycosyltransferase family 4 protein [Winogradskyella sp. A3E31]|uniref:glycosyltransferase family 4 protein n=1 Tax=Winogradskyella sp. A3E31 TaxID=3349637 RepID=UPI00398B5CF4
MQKQKKIKIAVVTGTFPSVSETFVINHVKGLLKAGIHVDFYCLHKDTKALNHTGLDPKVLTVKGLQPKTFVQRLKCIFKTLQQSKYRFLWQTIKTFNIFKYGKEALIAKQFFKAYYLHYFQINSYDVVHIHFATNAVKLLPLLKNFKNKIVVTFHGYDAHKYQSSYYKALQTLPNIHYTVNTNYTLKKVLGLGFQRNTITILPVAVDTELFAPKEKQKPNALFSILFVGRLVPFKAPLRAIKIVEKLIETHKDVKLTIIGGGELYDTCSNYIEQNGLSEHVRLLGALSQQKIKLQMELADVFLYPGIVDDNGRCENQGLVVQEAQAMGLPVVVSNVGGLAEGVIDGETGFVVEENLLDVFVEKLIHLKSSSSECHKLASNAIKFIDKHYTTAQHVQRLILIYKDHCDG